MHKDPLITEQLLRNEYDHLYCIPSFRLRDNSVHVHECAPFWVGIYTICI